MFVRYICVGIVGTSDMRQHSDVDRISGRKSDNNRYDPDEQRRDK
jgi:hypothetical protein